MAARRRAAGSRGTSGLGLQARVTRLALERSCGRQTTFLLREQQGREASAMLRRLQRGRWPERLLAYRGACRLLPYKEIDSVAWRCRSARPSATAAIKGCDMPAPAP